jgi:hypothetical protein
MNKQQKMTTLLVVFFMATSLLVLSGCGNTGENPETTAPAGNAEMETSGAETEISGGIVPQTADNRSFPGIVPEGEQPGMPGGGSMMGIDMGELSGILGINEENLAEAFSQAMSEMFENRASLREDAGDWQPPEENNRQPPADMPDTGQNPTPGEDSFQRAFTLPVEVLDRGAEILNIDQQELEDAINSMNN